MITRKIAGNILASLLAPVVILGRWIPNICIGIFYGEYNYYDFSINSLNELICAIYCEMYLPLALLSAVFLFLPFQLIKSHFLDTGKPLSFIHKTGLTTGMVILIIVVLGSFSNIWYTPWYKNFWLLVYCLVFGIFFASLLHVLVDRHEERKLQVYPKI